MKSKVKAILSMILIAFSSLLASCLNQGIITDLSKMESKNMSDTGQVSLLSQSGEKEYYSSEIGMWYTVWWQSDGEETPTKYRTYAGHWNDWSRFEPVRGYYSSGDPKIIKEHFTLFRKYGINYLIIDDTNRHTNDGGSIAYNIDQLFKVADEMGSENVPKIAIALGGSLKKINSEDAVRSRNIEAGTILANYINVYPDIYFNWKDKPLLVSYGLTKYFTWDSPKFTVRYATGSFYEAYHSAEGVPKTGFWGWVFSGQSDNNEIYGVIPGFNKGLIHAQTAGAKIPQIKREHGEHYMDMWLEAIKANRETIVITSWNDFAEEPAIEAAVARDDAVIDEISARMGNPFNTRHERDKLNGTDRHNIWLDYYGESAPYWYEEITWAYASLKTKLLDGYYYREEGSDAIFQYKDGALTEQTQKPHLHPVIRIPDDYFEWFFSRK